MVSFVAPHEPLAPLWVGSACWANYCNCDCTIQAAVGRRVCSACAAPTTV